MDANLGGLVLLDDAEGYTADAGEVFCGVLEASPAQVFSERYVECPMQLVLYAPKELGNAADFVGFVVHLDLAEGRAILLDPGGDHVNWALLRGLVEAPPQNLCVNGNVLSR